MLITFSSPSRHVLPPQYDNMISLVMGNVCGQTFQWHDVVNRNP